MKQLSQRTTNLCAMNFLHVPPMPVTHFLSSNMDGYCSYHLQTGGIIACFRHGVAKRRSLISGCEKTHILIASYQVLEQVINKDKPSSSSYCFKSRWKLRKMATYNPTGVQNCISVKQIPLEQLGITIVVLF